MIRVNPSISQAEIERDPVANRAEYLCEWRADVEGFSPRNVVEACVLNAPVRDDTREVQ